LAYLALTTVGVVQGNLTPWFATSTSTSSTEHFIDPHELPHKHDTNKGKKKLQLYRHRLWGDSPASTTTRRRHVAIDEEAAAQLQDQLLMMLHQQIRGGAMEDEDSTTLALLANLENNLDYSDNRDQVRVLKHHYLNEFGHHISVAEVLKDYSENCIIHQVMDNVPRTFQGRDGARQAFVQLFNLIPHDMSHSLEFEHVAIDHNHAQVVWKAEVPSQNKIIRGIDSFAFDHENRIVHQTIMAASIPFEVKNDEE
jgi:hypothetical protein